MKNRKRILRIAVVLFALLFAKAMGCSGTGAGCGGCGGPLTKAIKFPIENGIQLRVTDTGFNFVENNLRPILDQFLPNGLNFCIPRQRRVYEDPLFGIDLFRYAICGNSDGSTYRDGSCTNACEIDLSIRTVDIRPDNTNDLLQIYLLFNNIDTTLRMSADAFEGLVGATCNVRLRSNSFPVTADLKLEIDPATKRLAFGEDLNARIDISNLNLSATVTGNSTILGISVCPLVQGLADILINTDIVRNLILTAVQGPIRDAVNSFANAIRCVQCSTSSDCRSGSSCQSGSCVFTSGPSAGRCVPIPVGTEAEFDVGGLLATVAPGLKAILRTSLYAGGYVDVINNGVSLGMITGIDSEPSTCVPSAEPPLTTPVPRASALNSNFIPCAPGERSCVTNPQRYQAGIAISERFLLHALSAVYHSGMLCINASSDLTDFLSTSNFSLFLPSLKRLTEDVNRPMLLKVEPTEPPNVSLGQGRLQRDGSGNLVLDANGLPIIEEPLMTVRVPNLNLAFHAMVDDRLVKLFTLTADVALPMAIYFRADGSMAPVVGDISQAFSNVRVSDSAILKEQPDVLAGVIEIALQQALPFVVTALQGASIQIPDVQGFKLLLDDRRVKSFESGSPTQKFLGLFTDLQLVPPSSSQFRIEAQARLTELSVPDASTYSRLVDGKLPKARAVLELSGTMQGRDTNEIEFQYRLDRGPWSLFTPSKRIVVTSPLLLLQGVHALEVRARHKRYQTVFSENTALVKFRVDSVPPKASLRRTAQKLTAEGRDSVTAPSQLRYSWKVNGGEWSTPNAKNTLDLNAYPKGPVKVAVKVLDEAGNETLATGVFASHGRTTDTGNDGCGSGSCATGGGSSGLLGLFAALAALLLLSRRRLGRSLPFLLVAMGMALALGGCSEETPGPPPVTRCTSDADCKPDEQCHVPTGLCIPATGCRTDADCGPGQYCADDLDGDGRRDCAFERCTQDSECNGKVTCSNNQVPTCEAGECGCGEPCRGACPEGKFCCLASNSCSDMPTACVVACSGDGECSSFGANSKCNAGQCGCGPGYSLNVRSEGQLDAASCQLTGVSCTCDENPPLPEGEIGRYSGATITGGALWASAYNTTYGDLMVGKYDERQGKFDWTFVDGVPATGTIVGAPSGPRGGLEDKGDDVGKDTSIVSASDGTLHIAYRDVTAGVLKYARGTPGTGGTMSFQIHVVDDAGKTGRFTSMVLDQMGRPAIAYMTTEVLDGNARKSRARLARAKSATPGAAADWDLVTLQEVGLPAVPCGGGCPSGEVCAASGRSFACSAVDTGGCTPACGSGQACVSGSCRDLYQPPTVIGLPEGTGLFNSLAEAPDGKLWVAFYHRTRGNLFLVSVNGLAVGTPKLVDGEGAGGVDTGDVGHFASLAISADGKQHITYVNTTTDDLCYAVVDGNTATTQVIDTGLRTTGGEPVGPNNPDPQGDPRVVASHLVGDDSSILIDASGVVRVAYMDATDIDLVYAIRDGSGQWSIQTLAGNETPFTGAYGFHITHLRTTTGARIVNYKYNLKDESSSLDVRPAP